MVDGRPEAMVGQVDVILLVLVGLSRVEPHGVVGHAGQGMLIAERVRRNSRLFSCLRLLLQEGR